jgi:hypothetical protein
VRGALLHVQLRHNVRRLRAERLRPSREACVQGRGNGLGHIFLQRGASQLQLAHIFYARLWSLLHAFLDARNYAERLPLRVVLIPPCAPPHDFSSILGL